MIGSRDRYKRTRLGFHRSRWPGQPGLVAGLGGWWVEMTRRHVAACPAPGPDHPATSGAGLKEAGFLRLGPTGWSRMREVPS